LVYLFGALLIASSNYMKLINSIFKGEGGWEESTLTCSAVFYNTFVWKN
jgi:hypothetical protein